MQPIEKDELFQNLGDFLKSKGVQLADGSYAARIQQGCNLLSDAINATQNTVSKARGRVDDALDQLRQTIHEFTTPKSRGSGKTRSRRKPSKTPRNRSVGRTKARRK